MPRNAQLWPFLRVEEKQALAALAKCLHWLNVCCAAVFFLEFWKRKSANLSHHWETIGFEEEEERPRADYCARAPALEVNPITGVMEPHFPPKQRIRRMATGFAILCIMVSFSWTDFLPFPCSAGALLITF